MPAFGPGDGGRSPARAMARREDGFVVVLDPSRLLSESERDGLDGLAAYLAAAEGDEPAA